MRTPSKQATMLMRRHGFSTRVREGRACFSACVFMFVGGLDRTMGRGALLIVQMFTFTSAPSVRRRMATGGESTERLLDEIAVTSAARVSEDNVLLIRMGVSRTLSSRSSTASLPCRGLVLPPPDGV
jgi:hypothetical protein